MKTTNIPSAKHAALLRQLALAMSIIGSVLIGLALLWAFLLLFRSVVGMRFGLLNWAASLENSLAFMLRRQVPLRFGGRDFSHWVVVTAALGLGRLFLLWSEGSRNKAEYLRFQSDYEIWKRENRISDDSTILSPVNQVLDELRSGRLKDREQLLKVFGATKKKLDEIGRNLAFLSTDVVDSTGIKRGEEKAAVEHDFREYKNLLEGIFQSHGSLKVAWTPDGAMACFTTVDQAVASAKDVLAALPDFNRQTKTLRRDFAVRCGVNAGYVYFDDSLPLEGVTDRVLDIAAHLQCSAKPNSICLSLAAVELLNLPDRFTPSGESVHGYDIYEWRAP